MNLFTTYTRNFTKVFAIHKKKTHFLNENKGPATATVMY